MRWYLLSFSAQRFNYVFNFLNEERISFFCPMFTTHYRRPDKANSYRLRQAPAFPGYLFISLDFERYHPGNLAKCRYIHRLISFGGQPAMIDDGIVEQIRLVESQFTCEKEIVIPNGMNDHWREILLTPDPDLRVQRMILHLKLMKMEAA